MTAMYVRLRRIYPRRHVGLVRQPAFGPLSFAVIVGVGTAAGASSGAATSPTVAIVVAVLSSSVVAGLITWLQRRSTGEGPAAAARDMIEAAGHMAEASESMNLPLYRRIAEQQQEVADLASRLANTRIELHEAVNNAATLKAKIAGLEYEMAALRIRLGEEPGRRAGDA